MRITQIWTKPLGAWTLFDLLGAVILISLASVTSGFALSVAAIPPVVSKDWRNVGKTGSGSVLVHR